MNITKKHMIHLIAATFFLSLLLLSTGLSIGALRKFMENKALDRANDRISIETFKLYPQPPSESELASMKRATAIYELRSQAYMEEYQKYSSTIANNHGPKDEVDLYFSLMSSVKMLHEKANSLDIWIPKDCCFSFEPYLKKDLIPSTDEIHLLYRQSIAILKLLQILFKSKDPGFEFISIERESIAKDQNNLEGPYTFSIVDTKSHKSKTKNLESSLFRIIFIGYTKCLRNFMNSVVKKTLPIFFREIKISAIDTPKGDDKDNQKVPAIIAEHHKSKIQITLEWLFMNHDNELSQQAIKE
ncbi:MAG: Amuc_1100 family pilus-like protein [Puniceicoccales bacterium]|jgi:hypothetical protein|nr:Amuc_1100 family pilus-like protein [Puniceicoccales bacterium]